MGDNSKLTGSIISRHWADKPVPTSNSVKTGPNPKLHLIYWLKCEKGPVKVVISGQFAVFFIARCCSEAAIEYLNHNLDVPHKSWHVKNLDLRSFDHHKVTAFYFDQQRLLYRARQVLRESGIDVLESDVQPTERFLMERFVTSTMSIEGVAIPREGYIEFDNPCVERSPHHTFEKSLRLKVLSLDIETSMDGKRLYSIASYCRQYQADAKTRQIQPIEVSKVFMLGRTDGEKIPHTVFCANEKALLRAYLQWFEEADPDIIIGWSVINFDLRFLQRKADALDIPLTMGRDRQTLDWRQGRDDKEYFTLALPGRAVLDGIDTLKSATYNFESFSLQNVSNSLLNRGKLIHDVDNRGQEITRLFEQNKEALAKYNLEDCRLVWDIFEHANLIDFALARADLTGLALGRFGGSVAAFDNRYLPRLHRQGYVAPALKTELEGVGSPGGYVMDSQPGLYENVLVFDFKSLYPSIIRTFNIDPLALACGDEKAGQTAVTNGSETKVGDIDHFVAGFNGAVFDKSVQILPQLIEELWHSRDYAKKSGNTAMSQAIKILMNSFYGVMGTPGCRFFDARLPSSVTLRGHQILYDTRAFIEKKGYVVIYGDTDSLFIWLKEFPVGTSGQDIFTLGQNLVDELNCWWKETLRNTYHLVSALELEFETYFSRFIMPTIRGSDAGSKKRYAGRRVFCEEKRDDELVFKGLETVRTDWTPLARRFQQELYRRVFFDEPYKEYVLEVVQAIHAGEYDKELVYRKRLRRDLADYVRNIPPHVQAARLDESARRQQGLSRRYRRGSWVEYVYTLAGAEPLSLAKVPLDYERYVERQIAPIVDGIVQFLDTSFDEIAGQQLGLF